MNILVVFAIFLMSGILLLRIYIKKEERDARTKRIMMICKLTMLFCVVILVAFSLENRKIIISEQKQRREICLLDELEGTDGKYLIKDGDLFIYKRHTVKAIERANIKSCSLYYDCVNKDAYVVIDKKTFIERHQMLFFIFDSEKESAKYHFHVPNGYILASDSKKKY